MMAIVCASNIGRLIHAYAIPHETLAMTAIIAPAAIRVATLIANPLKSKATTFEGEC